MEKPLDRWITWTGLAIAAVILLSIAVKAYGPMPSAVAVQPSD